MQPSNVTLCPVDHILEHCGFHVLGGTSRQAEPFWHRHRGIELLFVHSGTANAYSQTWHRTLRPGQVIMNYAHIDHGSSGYFQRTVLHFVPELVPETQVKLAKLLGETDCVCLSLNPTSVSRLLWSTQELSSLYDQSRSRALVQALIGLIIAEIEVSVQDQPQKSAYADALLAVIAYMRENIASEENLSLLAERFRISTGHLHYLFRTYYGCSPRQYWLSLKLDQACRLLTNGQPVQDISTAVGFQSVRGFQLAFQRFYRMSPSDYRASLAHTQCADLDPFHSQS